MAYGKDGYPTELANKVGHVKFIEDPMIQRLIEAFEDTRVAPPEMSPDPSGRVDLSGECSLTQVITVDGGHQLVPNMLRPERQVGFVQVAVQLVKLETMEYLRQNPMADPREVQSLLGRHTHHILAALPVVGVHLSGLSVRQSLRDSIHRFIQHYGLYPAFAFLVYRQWEARQGDPPSMDCLACGQRIVLPRGAIAFKCHSCRHDHTLSDYLGLCDQDSEDRSTGETVSNLRSALEALALFALVIQFRDTSSVLSRTLFVLDGPLILRAQLSRLVEPIRDFLQHQAVTEKPVYLVGVEKSGEFRNFADAYAPRLESVGEYLLPSTAFLVEEVNGRSFNEATYRNRVNYGAKVVARVAQHHVLALDVPTGPFLLRPTPDDLIGFEDTVRCLGRLVSYRYENALIPLVLANTSASLSNHPSGDILAHFLEWVVDGGA